MATQRTKDLACAAEALSAAAGYLEKVGADTRVLVEVQEAVRAALRVEALSGAIEILVATGADARALIEVQGAMRAALGTGD